MSATVNCPQCHSALEVPDKLPPGKRLGCPDCGTTFLPGGAIPRHRPRYEDDYEDDDRRLPRERSSGGTAALLLGVLVTLLLVGGITALFIISLTRESETTSVVGAPSALPADQVPGANPPPQDRGRRGRGGATMRERPPQATGKQGDTASESRKPDPAPATQLAEEVAVGAYRVRPPKDFVAEKVAPQDGNQTYRWKGPGGSTVFEVRLSPAPTERNLETLLEKEIGSVAGSRGLGWGCSLAEPVTINGLSFVRASWSFQARPPKTSAAGVVYVALDGDTLIRMSFRDPAPRPGGPGEAAPQTFRKAAK